MPVNIASEVWRLKAKIQRIMLPTVCGLDLQSLAPDKVLSGKCLV
jgi:hypothetical protein